MDTIQTQLQQHFPELDLEEIQELTRFFRIESLEAKAYFTREGEVCDRLSIVQGGLLRLFALLEDGREITQWIATEGYLITEVSGFFFDLPNRWSIQAYALTELLTIRKADYQLLCDLVPKWNVVEKRMIAGCFSMMENRIFSHLALSAEERYDLYFASNPKLFNQVPLQHIASVLGMTPETFSRIRRRKMKS